MTINTTVLRRFEEFGRLSASSMPALRFNEGTYLIDNRDVNFSGMKLVANMPTARIGWVRWDSGYPVKEVMGLLSEGFQPPMRDEIGDFDRNLWPDMAKEGYPLDPWRLTQDLVLWDLENDQYEYRDTCYRLVIDDRAPDDGLPTGSESFGVLCQVYAAHAGTAPDDLPMIELDAGSYQGGYVSHPVTFHYPKLNVIGWYSQAAVEAAHQAELETARDAAVTKVVKLPRRGAARRRA
jgi:hypothetical protein